MKTVGLLLLFGACVMLGMRLASQRSLRFRKICALIRQLGQMIDAIDGGETSLWRLAARADGALFSMLQAYLDARTEGLNEPAAAVRASEVYPVDETTDEALRVFFCGLSDASAQRLSDRFNTLETALLHARQEAETIAKQAKTIRAIGVLAGIGICILLL